MIKRILTKRNIIILVVLLVVVVLGLRLKSGNGTIAVRPVELINQPVVRSVTGSGAVTADTRADLSFGVTGTIQNLNIKKGDEVVQGQFIASVANADLAQNVNAAKDLLDIANRDRQLYIENYETNQDAVGGKDEYKIGLKRQNELVSNAEADYQSSLATLAKTSIYAPFSGTVLDVPVSIGESIAFGTTVAKIADLNTMIFELDLDQEDFGLVKIGQQAVITLDSHPDINFSGTVLGLPLYTDPDASSDFTVDLKITGVQVPVLVGMVGDAEITVEEVNGDAMSLTFDEVFYEENGEAYVWVIGDGNTLKKMPVEVGLEGDIYTQILTPINEQIVVPVDADKDIQEGAKVKIEEG